MEISLAPLEELAAALRGGGVRCATTDPAELILPGVLVEATGIDLDLLDGYTITARLLLVVDNTGVARSMLALTELLNLVVQVIDPSDTVTPAAVTLPGSATPLPGLTVPIDLPITGETS